MCAMDEYARIRFTRVSRRASRLPTTMLAAATAHRMRQCVGSRNRNGTTAASTAPFDALAMSPATGPGAASYTSAAHMWQGAAANLKATPTRNSPNPAIASGSPQTLSGHLLRDQGNFHRPKRRVDEGQTENQEAAGESRQRQIHDTTAQREPVPIAEGNKHVEDNRQNLDPEEQTAEMAHPRKHGHAKGREQHQRVPLATVAVWHGARHQRPGNNPQEDDPKRPAQRRRDNPSAKFRRVATRCLAREHCRRGSKHQQRHPPQEAAYRTALARGADEKHHRGTHRQDELRKETDEFAHRLFPCACPSCPEG